MAEDVRMAAVTGEADASPALPRGWGVGVEFRKRRVTSRWVDFEWETAAVELSMPVTDAAAPAPSGPHEVMAGDEPRWRYDGAVIDLHPSEGEGYWLNLNSPAPCIFVMWRLDDGDEVPHPVVVTVSYNEAGRMLDAGDHVDNVPMPDAMKIELAGYTQAHYKPEPRRKMKRNDPFKDGAFRRHDDRDRQEPRRG